MASCSIASWPMTVWCISTCESTEPSAYLASPLGEVTHASMASEMAMPSEPGEAGSSSSTLAPNAVLGEGDGWMDAPQLSMKALRYGFCS